MKNLIYLFLAGAIALSACQSPDKAAKLAELKKQKAEIEAEIETLSKELAGADSTREVKTKLVGVQTVAAAPFEHYINVQGQLDAEQNIMLSSKSAGAITKVLVKSGDNVNKGQLLAEVDNALLLQSKAELQTQLSFAENIYKKQKNLWDQKIGSEVQFLTAKNNYEAMVKRMATLDEQIEMSRIRAPFAGSIDEVLIKEGQLVSPGLPCLRIVNFSELKVTADLAESYSSKVKVGQEVKINLPDIGKTLKARITYVSKTISSLNRTFTAEAIITERDPSLKPNMVANLQIVDYKTEKCFSVPVNTVQQGTEGSYVTIVKEDGANKVATRILVETGLTANDRIEVKKGLQGGEVLIVTGYQNLNEGELVSIAQ